MKKRTNIFSKLQSTGKALLLLSKLALAAVILAAAVPQSVYAADTQTQGSSYKSAKDYYNAQESVSIKRRHRHSRPPGQYRIHCQQQTGRH
ncbi:MAG: hypothetical protein ACLU99_02170 [Alphaproteobacteria bacterium]